MKLAHGKLLDAGDEVPIARAEVLAASAEKPIAHDE
jgi:hypothetical protein